MADQSIGTDLVNLHSCIKNGDTVTIKAVVVEGKHGPIVTLHAHGQRCKKSIKPLALSEPTSD